MTVDRSVESRGKLPKVWRGAGLALAAALMAACGGGGESGAPSQLPTRSGANQPSVTATIPSPTRALPDRSKSPDDTLTATPEPTRTQTETATQTETQTATETATQTATATPRETSETPSPTDSVSPAAKKNSGDETDVPAWLWWLLGAAIVACCGGYPVVHARQASPRLGGRARRRRAGGHVVRAGVAARAATRWLSCCGRWGLGRRRVSCRSRRGSAHRVGCVGP